MAYTYAEFRNKVLASTKKTGSLFSRKKRIPSELNTLMRLAQATPLDRVAISQAIRRLQPNLKTTYLTALKYLETNALRAARAQSYQHSGPMKQRYKSSGDVVRDGVRFCMSLNPRIPDVLTVTVSIFPYKTSGGSVNRATLGRWNALICKSWSGRYKLRRRGVHNDRGRVMNFAIAWNTSDTPLNYMIEVDDTLPNLSAFTQRDLNRAKTMEGGDIRRQLRGIDDAFTQHTGLWGENDSQAIFHEFGHLIGCPDEYDCDLFNGYGLGITDITGFDAPGYTTDSIMNRPTLEAKMYPRHYFYVQHAFERWQGLSRNDLEVVSCH